MFADIVAGSLAIGSGRRDSRSDAAVRLLWEDTLRALLADATDQPIPTVTGLATPAAWASVERLIGDASLARHRATLGGIRPVRDTVCAPDWSRTLREVLVGPAEPPR